VGTLFGQSEHSQLSGLDENTLKALIHTDFGLKVTRRRPGQSAHLRRTNRRTAAHDTAILIRLLR
jgi:hypothetical protein